MTLVAWRVSMKLLMHLVLMRCLAIVFTHASPADAGPKPAEKKRLIALLTKAGDEVIVG